MAFFLGAGISRAAGIPSGSEILKDTCTKYYLACNGESPAEEIDVVIWAKDQLGSDIVTYSNLLEQVYPSPPARQEYLRGFFEGKIPTNAHRCLAKMAKDGFIKVFITTNFDHLLETALDEAGVSWTRVSSPDELKTARPREHSDVYILKPHGDYTSSAIRNTPQELETLDDNIEKELLNILWNFGLVVLGYAGADVAIKRAFFSERARYGVYWLSRGELTSEQQELLRALDARQITATDADAFCADLQTRINAIVRHPDGKTPETLRVEITNLIRDKDRAGVKLRAKQVSERLLKDSIEFGERYRHRSWRPGNISAPDRLSSWEPVFEPVLDALAPAMDAFLSAAIAAGEFEINYYDWFINPLTRIYRTKLPGDGLSISLCIPEVPAMLVGNSLLVAGLATESWNMFVKTALAIDLKRGIPWTMTSDFHHLSLLGRRANLSAGFIQHWLDRSESMQQVKRFDQDFLNLAVQANVLLNITARAKNIDGPAFWWGYMYDGDLLEPLVKLIAYNITAAEELAKLIDGNPENFKREFVKQYKSEVVKERYRSYSFIALNSDVLGLLSQNE